MEQHRARHLIPPSQRLPLEVQFLVLDEVPKVSQTWVIMRDSLRSCALTCQAWLPRAHRHLYHTVYLDAPWQTPLLARTLTEFPITGPLIKHLHVPCFSYIVVNGHPERLPGRGYVPLAANAVSKLTSLRSVAFRVPTNDYAPPFFFPLVQSFSVLGDLESLSFHNAMFPSTVIRNLLSSFPAIRSIAIDKCQWYGAGQPAPDANAYPDRYRDLRDLRVCAHHIRVPTSQSLY